MGHGPGPRLGQPKAAIDWKISSVSVVCSPDPCQRFRLYCSTHFLNWKWGNCFPSRWLRLYDPELGLSISPTSLPEAKYNQPFPGSQKIPVRLLCGVTNGSRTSGQLCPQPKIAATRLVQAGSFVFPVVETSLEACLIFFCVEFCFVFEK